MSDKDKKYQITILNWDKYQREMKGGEKRRRHREWIAVSTRVYSDPDFLRLTIEQRYTWLMLVCYAGAVGPVFKLSASDARVLFKLRRSADFQVFKNQGFIDLRAATNSTDITVQTEGGAKRAPTSYEPSVELLKQLAAETGMTFDDLMAMLREMKDHEFKSAKKDWDAVFRNWVRRAVKWAKENPRKKLTYAEQLAEDIDASN